MRHLALGVVLMMVACKDQKPAAGGVDATLTERLADAAPSMAKLPVPDAAVAAAPAPDGGATTAEAPAKPPAPTGKKVGVESCDEYLEKMARCITKLSADSAEPMRANMEDTRAAWQQTAATPEGRAALADACRSALEVAQSSAKAMGCPW